MFQQCGHLHEEKIIEMDNYQDFLKVLHHHTFMDNVSTTQLTHFIMLMVYMSFCRLNHYTRCMTDKEAVLLKVAVQMTLVIMAFRTTFSMKGGHNIINPYSKHYPQKLEEISMLLPPGTWNRSVHAKIMYSVTSILHYWHHKWCYQAMNISYNIFS